MADHKRLRFYSLALSLLLTGNLVAPVMVLAQTIVSPALVQPLRTLEGISEYQLPNGLRVLLFPDNSKPTITVNITYLVGSRHEGLGETGMAHLLEHMVFKGTPTFTNVPKALQEHGADFNGSTWYDRTNYFETMTATDENLRFGINLEADRMINSFVRKSDLDSEFSVVRNEFESGENDPSGVLEERVFSTAYLWHNYGKSTIGSKSDLEKVPIDKLQAFYRKYYQPDNAVLVVAGRFDQDKAKTYIQQYFGTIPKPSRTLEQPYTEEPAQDGERQVSLRRVGKIQVFSSGYHIPQGAHPDLAALQVLDHILTNTPSGRLYKALVDTKKATRVSGTVYQLYDPGMYYLSVQAPKDKSLAEIQTLSDKILQDVAAKGVTAEEVQRAKVAFDKGATDLMNSSQGLAITLSEYAAMGDWRLFFIDRDRLQGVTREQVQKVAQTYLRPVNRTLGFYYPTNKPEKVDIPGGVNLASTVESYTPKASTKEGETFELTAANLLKRTQRLKLTNGLSVVLLPKKTRGETVVAQFTFFVGDRKRLADKKSVNTYVATMLNRGTTTLTRQQLRDKLDQLKAQVAISGSLNQTTVSISTIRPNFEEVLRLVGTMLRAPAFDPKELDTLKQQRLTALDAVRTEPQQIASDTANVTLYNPSSVLYAGTLDERIERVKKLDIAQLKAFHKTFYGASVGTMAVIGDFDPTTVSKKLQQILGIWTAPQPGTFINTTLKDLATTTPAPKTISIPDKPNAVFIANAPLTIKEDDPQFTALEAGVYIFGGGALSSRFADRVRQKDGLSYGAGSSLSSATRSEFSVFFNGAISNNENSPKVENAFKEELQILLDKGITPAELKRTQDALIQEQWVSLSEDGALAATSNELVLQGKTFQELADREQRIRALTVEQVNQALRTYLKPQELRIVKAGDLK